MIIGLLICIFRMIGKGKFVINGVGKYVILIYFINLIILTLPTFYSPFFSNVPILYFRTVLLYIFQLITFIAVIIVFNVISIYDLKLLLGRVLIINSILSIGLYVFQLFTKPFVPNTMYIGIIYTYQKIPRMLGFMSDPNYFALYITVFVWVYLFLPVNEIKIDSKKIILAIICIILTQSRAAIIFNIVGMILFFAISRNNKVLIISLLSGSVFFILIKFFIPNQLLEESLLRFNFKQDPSSIIRYNLLQVGIENIFHYPFGVGIGYIMEYYNYLIGTYKVAHNDFISIFIEGGIVSLLLYVSIFIRVFLNTNKLGKIITFIFVLFLNTLTAYYFDPIVPIFIAMFSIDYKFKTANV